MEKSSKKDSGNVLATISWILLVVWIIAYVVGSKFPENNFWLYTFTITPILSLLICSYAIAKSRLLTSKILLTLSLIQILFVLIVWFAGLIVG